MRRTLLSAALFVSLLVAGRPGSAAIVPSCCACVEQHLGMTSQAAPAPQALFCGFVEATTYLDFTAHCESASGNDVLCTNALPGQTCNATLLAESSIACPPASPAPTATAWGLGALALALAGLGVAGARRRAR